MPKSVAAVFATYPPAIRRRLLELRDVIFETAASVDDVGDLTETLKWGEPAYLPVKTRIGSTIRLGWKASVPNQYALYFNCNTTLVDSFRTYFPELHYGGNRAVLLEQDGPASLSALAHCIELTLTYHVRKRRAARA